MLYTAADIFSFLACSSIFSTTKTYSCILRHCQVILSLIQVYSLPWITCIITTWLYSDPWHVQNQKHVQNPMKLQFIILPQSEQFIQALFSHIQANSGPCIMLAFAEPFLNCIPTHIQNPVIFTKIGKLSITLEIQKPGHNDNPAIFRTLTYLIFRTLTYLQK